MRPTPKNNIVKQSEVKKINATITQIISFAEFKDSEKSINENQFVLALLRFLDRPTTRRHIQQLSGLPINHLTRVFYDLVTEGSIIVCKHDKCNYTNRTVQFYSVVKTEVHE